MSEFDAARIELYLRRHGWSAYAYEQPRGQWGVVCHWSGDEGEPWAHGIEGAWRHIRSMRGALQAISTHSARDRKGETA